MARIRIEPAKAKRSVQDELSLEKKLSSLSHEVSTIRSNMRYKISGREQISERLRQVAQQISKEAVATKALGNGLQQIVAKYEQTENTGRDRLKVDKTSVQETANGGTSSDSFLSKLRDWVNSPEYKKQAIHPARRLRFQRLPPCGRSRHKPAKGNAVQGTTSRPEPG